MATASGAFDAIWRAGDNLLVRIVRGQFVVIDPTGAIVQRYSAGTEPEGIFWASYYVIGARLLTTSSIPEASDTGEYEPSVVLDALVLVDDPDTRRFVETVLGDAAATATASAVE